MFSNFND